MPRLILLLFFIFSTLINETGSV